MIKKYPAADAERNLVGILSEVESGTMVHLTEEDGHTAVVMMSLAEYHRLAHGWRPAPPREPPNFKEIAARFQEAFKADGANLDDAFDGIREEWKRGEVQP